MRVSNLRQNMDSKKTLRLIRGSTYTRVYTVIKTADRKELVTLSNVKNTYEQPTPRGALEMLKIKERTEKG